MTNISNDSRGAPARVAHEAEGARGPTVGAGPGGDRRVSGESPAGGTPTRCAVAGLVRQWTAVSASVPLVLLLGIFRVKKRSDRVFEKSKLIEHKKSKAGPRLPSNVICKKVRDFFPGFAAPPPGGHV